MPFPSPSPSPWLLPRCVLPRRRGCLPGGYYYHRHEGRNSKNTIRWGPTPGGEYPGRVSPSRGALAPDQRGHHVPREPAELFLELLGREPLGPVDHEVFEARVLRLDGLDAVDDVPGWAAEPRFRRDAVGERRCPRGRAGRAPRAPLLVCVAHEPERREPLVALVVRRLHTPLRFFGRVGEIEARAPDHVLAELLRPAVLRARVAVGLHHVVADLLAVQRDHCLEVLRRHR